MSLGKAITHGKEYRKPYRGSKEIDPTCRNHGGCDWCRENRQHKFRDKESDTVRVEITYYAFDDTEFDSKAECEAYEEHMRDAVKAVAFFDADDELILNPTLEDIEAYAMTMYVLDGAKAEHLFKWLSEQISFCMDGLDYPLIDGDIYIYNNETGGWKDLRMEADSIRKRIDGFAKAVAEL